MAANIQIQLINSSEFSLKEESEHDERILRLTRERMVRQRESELEHRTVC